MAVSFLTHPPLSSLCLLISSFYFFFSLSRLIDWLIKPITEITKSNQVQTSATCRLVEKQEYVGGAGTRPNAAEQIRPKTEQLQAKAILRELWEDDRKWSNLMRNKVVVFWGFLSGTCLAGSGSPDVCWTGSPALAAKRHRRTQG